MLYTAWASQFYFILMENSSLSTANLFAFMTIAMGSIGSVLGGYFADRVGRTAVCAVCTICSATVSIAIGPAAVATQSEPLVWALAFLWGLTVVADSAQYSAMISELCPADLVGTALTLQLSSGYSATVVSILVLPTIANSTILTWEWSYAVAGVVSYLGLFMLLWLRYLPESEKICGGKK
ncbi:hypothetical protein SARC_04597 [Sphaeroforma arctica JP610]|uniref:Major facilitator superfamily (MFS) profile domain-containing protein n=1 Tax=Sphaeroforma arctica JP610 TaxID=667725 RepID=A0A0L0G2W0_9EUKA|nr:hypothetical protein SARC_04597 [Sphaeroforma arctica JP610]KNC83146.1 hypothetical protein SARC_04597 [Sphaeroforma arctica JP610]|eukprot:XP_014157048.1 hypothetical protein SARC_04597 [Sphaeroforma arctica JP610]